MELLGLSVNSCGGGGETAQLLVHSHQDISMWQLSQVSQLSQHLHPISTDPLTSCLFEQLESHFASMFSNTVALSRVESPDETRIMATAEVIPISLIQHFLTLSCGIDIISQDGSVRLLSPVTGEIITTFFPIFTADVCTCTTQPFLFITNFVSLSLTLFLRC